LARIDSQPLSPLQHRSAKAQIHFDSDSCAGRTGERSHRARQCTARIGEVVRPTVAQVWRGASEPELAAELSVELREVLEPLLVEIESLNERIKEYEVPMEKIARESYSEVKRPGLRSLRALVDLGGMHGQAAD
jgi:hypothetical protein